MEIFNTNKETSSNSFWGKHPTFTSGFCAFCVLASSISFYFGVLRIDKVWNVVVRFFDIIEPVTYGLAIAFLLNPIMQQFEKLLCKIPKNKTIDKKTKSMFRGISIILSIIVALLMIFLVSSFVFPELIESLENIYTSIPSKIEYLNKMVDNIINSNKFVSDNIDSLITYATDHLTVWIKTTFSEKLAIYINYITNSLTSVVNIVFNVVIGLACSIYLLFNKEKFMAQCKKMLFAFLKSKKANNVIAISKESYDIFAHSIIGKIIDSIILGFICFVLMKILHFPYPVLISVIIGITNVIPLFGPWIGGLPCGLLVMLTEPSQTIYFAILILFLQQFDANFLTPKVVGNYIGLPAFWVIVSCLIGGGFFGVLGLILCVPIFGILYHLFSRFLSKKLNNKELPTSTEFYKKNRETLKNKIPN